MSVSPLRISTLNARPLQPKRDHVLYWMTATRRTTWNHALDRALEHAHALDKPLLVVEALRAGHRWACDRFHQFVLDGMADNAAAFDAANIRYVSYVEPTPGAGKGLIEALAAGACVVVTDDWPCFFVPRMQRALAGRVDVCVEAVDSNGVLPVAAPGEQVFPSAYVFRRFLQKELPKHLPQTPQPTLAKQAQQRAALPASTSSWTSSSHAQASLAALPIDHTVGPLTIRGGAAAAAAQLERFLTRKLATYDEDRSDPDTNGQSGLSPWLHWGHLSSAQVVDAVLRREGWSVSKASGITNGAREGWWGLSASAEGFLDELITWREIGFNFCARRPDHDRWESLPQWARDTLQAHAADVRDPLYTLQQLEQGQTHDELWNAAQHQLRSEGVIHNYLRMLWGKKILEWSPSPQTALQWLIELNNKYAIDGRDPNSYSGIFWVLGRYDRPWGPERKIFGTIRYMSSGNTAKKHNVEAYLDRWGGAATTATTTTKKTAKKKPAKKTTQAPLL